MFLIKKQGGIKIFENNALNIKRGMIFNYDNFIFYIANSTAGSFIL